MGTLTSSLNVELNLITPDIFTAASSLVTVVTEAGEEII